LESGELQRPIVIAERCIGCGICEFQCPMGEAAIQVYRRGDVV
jgi:NAD-dependent dihydropyrimidine dehydrogenase PreA subunit